GAWRAGGVRRVVASPAGGTSWGRAGLRGSPWGGGPDRGGCGERGGCGLEGCPPGPPCCQGREGPRPCEGFRGGSLTPTAPFLGAVGERFRSRLVGRRSAAGLPLRPLSGRGGGGGGCS